MSCDVMSLFTRVLIDEPPGDCLSTSRGHHTSRQNLNRPRRSLHHHLTLSHNYLLLVQRYCLPADTGAAMGSPIFPIVANLYMEDSEKQALFSFPCKHRLWIRYVDDVFAVWLSKDHSLKEFITISIHSILSCNLQWRRQQRFTTRLVFLDVLVERKDTSNTLCLCFGRRLTLTTTDPVSTLRPGDYRIRLISWKISADFMWML